MDSSGGFLFGPLTGMVFYHDAPANFKFIFLGLLVSALVSSLKCFVQAVFCSQTQSSRHAFPCRKFTGFTRSDQCRSPPGFRPD